jgi:hypothetical protein
MIGDGGPRAELCGLTQIPYPPSPKRIKAVKDHLARLSEGQEVAGPPKQWDLGGGFPGSCGDTFWPFQKQFEARAVGHQFTMAL